MSVEINETAPPKFRVGSALGRSFKILFRNIVPFGLLAIIFNIPMQFVSMQLTDPGAIGGGNYWFLFALVTLGNLVLGLLLSATLVYGTVLELRGGRAGIVECVSRGLGSLLPVIGVGILLTLIISLGFLIFIIPGIIAFVALWVAVPAAVVERPGVGGSLSRSRELTKGNRWPLFGLILILIILSGVIGAVLGGLIGFGAVFTDGAELSFTVTLVINVVVHAFSGALLAVASAVAYHDLRIAKEGVSAEQIAAVFD